MLSLHFSHQRHMESIQQITMAQPPLNHHLQQTPSNSVQRNLPIQFKASLKPHDIPI